MQDWNRILYRNVNGFKDGDLSGKIYGHRLARFYMALGNLGERPVAVVISSLKSVQAGYTYYERAAVN